MNYSASCNCGNWKINLSVLKTTKDLTPRVCDCEFCQVHASAIVSDPEMIINLLGRDLKIEKCGDQLANFYLCAGCKGMLAVGSVINGELRGAVNSNFFVDQEFQETVQIRPKLLNAIEKQERWGRLWGYLNVEECN